MNPQGRNARDGANYVRIQKGHSIVAHIILGVVTIGISLPLTIYYALSPHHFWHL